MSQTVSLPRNARCVYVDFRRDRHPATLLRTFTLIGDPTPRARVRLDCGAVVEVEAAAVEGVV